MSMSISSSGYSTQAMQSQYGSRNRMPPPDPQAELSQAFANMDAGSKGYLDKTDLESALSASGSSASSDDLFSALDADTNGQVTEEEMANVLKNLCSGNDSARFAMRMAGSGGMGEMAPPPPPQEGEDEGFTVDQLSQMASDLAETDSQRASEFETLAASFTEADADGNGKLTRDEAMGFLFGEEEESASSSGTSATAATTSTDSTTSSALLKQIMALVKSYGSIASDDSADSLLSLQA